MTLVPLSRLLRDGRPDSHGVAQRGAEILRYGSWRRDVAANTARIAAAGVLRGLLVADDSYGFVVGLFALLQAGARVILPPTTREGSFRSLSGAFDRVITDRSDLQSLDPLVLASGEPAFTLSPLDPALPSMEFFTSGSTGDPKRIVKSLGQLEREITVLEGMWGTLFGEATVLGTVPHQHIFGLTFGVLWPLMAGRCFGATVFPFWESLFDRLRAPAAVITSPAHLTRLGGLQPLEKAKRPSIVFTAGAPLPFEAAAEARRIFGTLPVEIFGSTETGAIASRRQTSENTPWQAVESVAVSISNADLLTVRSPYLADDEPLITADRVRLDDRGFHFLGRADAVVKVEGKRVSLVQVERDLAALAWIEEAVVVSIAEQRSLVGAICRLSDQGRQRLSQIGQFRFERLLRQELKATQDSAALPRRWLFVDRIPVDGMGKKSRTLLADLLLRPRQEAPRTDIKAIRREPILSAIRNEANRVELDFVIPPDLFYFQGHFPDHPVLPGVVQLDWVLGFARRFLRLDGLDPQGFQVKFRRPIVPEAELVLSLLLDESRRTLSFDYRIDGEVQSSGRIALGST